MPVQWVLDYANRIFEGVRFVGPDDEAPYFKKAWELANQAYINALESSKALRSEEHTSELQSHLQCFRRF